MFLIEYDKDMFADAEQINWINNQGVEMTFTQQGDIESVLTVTKDYKHGFINQVSALNKNACCKLNKRIY